MSPLLHWKKKPLSTHLEQSKQYSKLDTSTILNLKVKNHTGGMIQPICYLSKPIGEMHRLNPPTSKRAHSDGTLLNRILPIRHLFFPHWMNLIYTLTEQMSLESQVIQMDTMTQRIE